MDEKKLPSASDLYRDRYQGKLKSMSDKRVRKLLLELPDSSILNYSWGDVYEEIGEYDSWDGPTLKEALHELAVAIEARKKADDECAELRKSLKSKGDECDCVTLKYEELLEKIPCAAGIHTWKKFAIDCVSGVICQKCGKIEIDWVR